MVYHLELNGLAQFGSLEESRIAIQELENILSKAIVSNVGINIYEPATGRNHSNVELTYDRDAVVYGGQAARAGKTQSKE